MNALLIKYDRCLWFVILPYFPTQDCGMFLSLKEWIQSLKKFSTMISESGEMQRIQFFQQQREIISTL